MEYLDFELRISTGSGRAYPVTVVRSPAGETRGTMQFPFDKLALDNQMLGLQNALLRSGSLRRQAVADPEESRGVVDFGKQLFQALFTPELQVAYRRSRDRAAAEDKGLRLRLRIDAPELASLPWEFMYDPTERDYVCLSSDTPLVRYLEFDQPPAPLTIKPPLSLLVMIASPADRPTLDVARERERIEQATRRLRSEGFMRIEWLQGSSWRDLQQALRGQRKHHIFHFVGHGSFDSAAGEGALMLTDEDGRASMISATAIARLLSDHRTLRLAVLNSCLGAKGSATDVLSSTAAILVGRGLPAVVAMQFEISDEAAIEFSRSLYDAIAEGLPIDAAVAEARKAMITRATSSVEWGTPVLHMRSPDGVLFRLDGTKPSEARATGNFPKPTWTPTEGIDATPSPPAPSGAAGASMASTPGEARPFAPQTERPAMPPAAPASGHGTAPAPSPPMRLSEPVAPTRVDPMTAHPPASAPASSRGLMFGVVGAIAVAAIVAAVLLRPGPTPSARLAAISDVRLLSTDTIDLVKGSEVTARYGVFGPGGESEVPNADSLLLAAGDRIVLMSSRGTVVRADTSHHVSGAFTLEALQTGVDEIWPVLMRANGDSAGSKRRTVVVVKESSATFERASEAFIAVRDALRADSVSDADLLARVAQLDSTHGPLLRGAGGRAEDLDVMVKGTGSLMAARHHADSVAADSNSTMQARYAALQSYRELVGQIRGGHGPTASADSARLVSFDAKQVGTVLKGGVCIGYPCDDSAALIAEARVGQRVGMKVWFVSGTSRTATLEWRRDGVAQGRPTPLSIDQYVASGWRAQGVREVREPGTWQVRVLNGKNQLVFRHDFVVR